MTVMKLQQIQEILPLVFTFGAVLLVGVGFFSFSKAEAGLNLAQPVHAQTVSDK